MRLELLAVGAVVDPFAGGGDRGGETDVARRVEKWDENGILRPSDVPSPFGRDRGLTGSSATTRKALGAARPTPWRGGGVADIVQPRVIMSPHPKSGWNRMGQERETMRRGAIRDSMGRCAHAGLPCHGKAKFMWASESWPVRSLRKPS
jgi:hypothetical protein